MGLGIWGSNCGCLGSGDFRVFDDDAQGHRKVKGLGIRVHVAGLKVLEAVNTYVNVKTSLVNNNILKRREEGGSGVPIDREKYEQSVEALSKHAVIS